MESILTTEKVDAILKDVFLMPDEIKDGKPIIKYVAVEAILCTFGFHSERLESHRAELELMVDELPSSFYKGASFLNACNTRHGIQWGEHKIMDVFFALLIACDLAMYISCRHTWHLLPGGMPYIITKSTRQIAEEKYNAKVQKAIKEN